METQKGILPVGLEFEGQVHKEFEIRRELVGDTVAAMDNPRAQHNKAYASLCIFSRRLAKSGSIPKDKVTPELLMNMAEEDFDAIVIASDCFRAGKNNTNTPDCAPSA